MTPKQEAEEIYKEIADIQFTNSIEFDTGWSDIEIEIPEFAIKKIAFTLIDRMTHKENSITQEYWRRVRKHLNAIHD